MAAFAVMTEREISTNGGSHNGGFIIQYGPRESLQALELEFPGKTVNELQMDSGCTHKIQRLICCRFVVSSLNT